MPNFRPNVLDAEELSPTARKVLRGTILIALRNRATTLHVLPFAEFYKRVGLPASTTKTQLIELLNEAKKALGLLEKKLKGEDDFVTPTGSTPVFSAIYIINSRIEFSLSTPMYMLSENDLNRLLPCGA